MTDTPSSVSPAIPLTASRTDQIFPTLTDAQVARLAAHGRTRTVQGGEVLAEAGEQHARFFVVITGRIDIVRPGAAAELVAVFRPGQFTGEINLLSGRRGFVRVLAADAGRSRGDRSRTSPGHRANRR